jgi:transcriptional repressor NrdR
MHCPFCRHPDTRVIDSRLTEDGAQVRRRRECAACAQRFTTFETIEFKPPNIVKSDGRREPFDENKLRRGIDRALQKRPVESEAVEASVQSVLRDVRSVGEREIPSRKLGDWVMRELRRLDQVAYVRFASVYRRFEDVKEFREEIEKLEQDLPAFASDNQLPLLDP